MSLAVTALLLLRLEARRGQWVPVALLCEHLGLHGGVVREHLESMAAGGTVVLQHDPGSVVRAARTAPSIPRPVVASGAVAAPGGPEIDLERFERPSVASQTPSRRFDPPVRTA